MMDFLYFDYATELVKATVIVPVPSLMSLSHKSAEAEDNIDPNILDGFSS
jgi:hypothetical protein